MSKSDDLRFGSLFVHENESTVSKPIKIAIIGYACDEGVLRNGGRIGAAAGPDIVRTMLKKKGCIVNEEYNVSLKDIQVKDFGDTIGGKDLKSIQKAHQELVESALVEGYIPIIIGGGNDQSYPNFLAILNHIRRTTENIQEENLLVVNIDAHLDVRPLLSGDEPHSGSPFRQVLETETNVPIHFVEFGCQGSQCSSDHVRYVTSRDGEIVWLRELHGSVTDGGGLSSKVYDTFRRVLEGGGYSNGFVSFDIDSIRAGDCPGVSCPSPVGLWAEEALSMCYLAGRCGHVRMMDISEFNPAVEAYTTATLIAAMVYHFAMGLAHRHEV